MGDKHAETWHPEPEESALKIRPRYETRVGKLLFALIDLALSEWTMLKDV